MSKTSKFLNKLLKWEARFSNGVSNNKKHGKNLRIFLKYYTELGSSLGAAVVFVLLFLLSGLPVLMAVLPVYLFQLIIVEGIKLAFNRPRPENGEKNKNVLGITITKGSFPSGHSANAFALAFLISSYYNLNLIATALCYSLACLIAASRLILGKHYALDIFGGAVIGLALASLGWLILNP